MNYRYAAAREVGIGALLSHTFGNLGSVWRELAAYLAGVVAIAFVLPLVGSELSGIPALAGYLAAQYWLFRRVLVTRGMLDTQGTHVFAFAALAALLIVPIMLGLAMFVLPGIFLVARTIAAPAFIVARGEDAIAAMRSSWQAVRGHSVPVMIVATLLVLGASVFGGAFAVIDGAVSKIDAFADASPGDVIQMQLVPLLLLGLSTAVYEKLGPEDNSIEEVFG
jgi:hypothetical protein